MAEAGFLAFQGEGRTFESCRVRQAFQYVSRSRQAPKTRSGQHRGNEPFARDRRQRSRIDCRHVLPMDLFGLQDAAAGGRRPLIQGPGWPLDRRPRLGSMVRIPSPSPVFQWLTKRGAAGRNRSNHIATRNALKPCSWPRPRASRKRATKRLRQGVFARPSPARGFGLSTALFDDCRFGHSGSPPMTAICTPAALAAARTRALNAPNPSQGCGSPSSSPLRMMISVGSVGAVCLSSANRRACSLCVSPSSQPRLCPSKAARRASISTSS